MAEIDTPKCKVKRIRELNIIIPASPLMKKIGFGTGVGVYLLERSSKELSPWAVKKFMRKKSTKENYKRLEFEAKVLRKLNHPNIVGFRGFCKGTDGKPCLAMEAISSSLGEMIEKRREMTEEPFPARNIIQVGFEMAKALKYLHHVKYILHGDIKSFNILVSPKFSVVKLCDFGHSLSLTPDLKENTKGFTAYVGTRNWLPPEVVFDQEPVTSAADIWSYGLVLWEMITLSIPHMKEDSLLSEDTTELEDSDADTSKVECRYGTRPPISVENLNLRKYKLVFQIFFMCTREDYKLRPTAKQLAKEFKQYFASKQHT